MLEKESSGVSPDLSQSSQDAGAAPGGPLPQKEPSTDEVQIPTDLPHRYTLQFLIAAIKQLSQ